MMMMPKSTWMNRALSTDYRYRILPLIQQKLPPTSLSNRRRKALRMRAKAAKVQREAFVRPWVEAKDFLGNYYKDTIARLDANRRGAAITAARGLDLERAHNQRHLAKTTVWCPSPLGCPACDAGIPTKKADR